jgi:acyl-CoA thioester hydrolase
MSQIDTLLEPGATVEATFAVLSPPIEIDPGEVQVSEEEILADLAYPASLTGRDGWKESRAMTTTQSQVPTVPTASANARAGKWTHPIGVRWADVDANGHMRNTAYSEFAADARVAFLADHGFPLQRLHELGIAPVIMTEELRYRRECMLGERLTVSVAISALSDDARRARVEQEISKPDGTAAAVVRLDGGWLPVHERALITPPPELAEVMRAAPRTDDFVALNSDGQ